MPAADPRWPEVKQLFDELADLDPAAAAARLATVTDAAVAAEVRSLLEWHHDSGTFLETPVIPVPAAPGALVGQSLGPWRVVDVIGRGGMGIVYRAERADDAFTRQAAIKVIAHGAGAAAVVERFRRERQTLADLDHRNIARLLDGGSTPDGQPYFVMEYVDGVPIDRYCDVHRLPVDRRLELFVRVCNGVQYAHENLVVHRDIKPDNILVTGDDTPKLLDFGVARLLDDVASAADSGEFAATWLLTPDFASPEQLAGRAGTTSTDVYSLGVVLYALLTGTRPYRLRSATAPALHAELEAAALRPPSTVVREGADAHDRAASRATSPPVLARQLAGDLDAIVMKALSRAPDARYSSVADLRRDIQAYRTSWPVSAVTPGAIYLTRKFVRRHRRGVAVAAVLAALALASVAAVVWQASIAARERARAERRFDDVRRLANTFMFDVNDTIANVPGTMATRALIVETTVAYLESLAREAGGDPALQRELARAWIRVGDVQGNPSGANLGDTAGALASYRQAIALAGSAGASAPGDVDAKRAAAGARRRLSDALAWSGDTAAALPESEHSKRLYLEVAAAPGATLDDRLEAAIASIKLGDLLGSPSLPNLARHEDAAAMFQTALAEFRAIDATTPDDARVQRFIGLSLERLGQLHEFARRWPEAEAAYHESFTIRQRLAAREPTHRNIQRDLAIAYEKLGKLEQFRKAPGGGIAHLRNALAQFERLAASDPADANAARSLAVSREVLAGALVDRAEPVEAVALYDSALSIHRQLSQKDAENVQARCDTARLLELSGDALAAGPGARAQACERWKAGLTVLEALQRERAAVCNTGGSSLAALTDKHRGCS